MNLNWQSHKHTHTPTYLPTYLDSWPAIYPSILQWARIVLICQVLCFNLKCPSVSSLFYLRIQTSSKRGQTREVTLSPMLANTQLLRRFLDVMRPLKNTIYAFQASCLSTMVCIVFSTISFNYKSEWNHPKSSTILSTLSPIIMEVAKKSP